MHELTKANLAVVIAISQMLTEQNWIHIYEALIAHLENHADLERVWEPFKQMCLLEGFSPFIIDFKMEAGSV